MILITGGAGFIGSNLHTALTKRGLETVIVDRLHSNGKWQNLIVSPPTKLISPDALDTFLLSKPPIKMVFHLGAISSTTAVDGDLVWAVNIDLSTKLWEWCARENIRFVYASSAATYGDGSAGFEDGIDGLKNLRPLNLYGWSKHVFDCAVAHSVKTRNLTPPQWVGLKFFNVYGPNEDHKDTMKSVIRVKFNEVLKGQSPRLFRSNNPEIADGDQKRDFVWVGDVVNVMTWLYDNPKVSGLFNVGSGTARSFFAMAVNVCKAVGMTPQIEFIDMPSNLLGSYQNFTEAPIHRLRDAGYKYNFTTLEDGITQYAKYLT